VISIKKIDHAVSSYAEAELKIIRAEDSGERVKEKLFSKIIEEFLQ
jgi:hypothetical protein